MTRDPLAGIELAVFDKDGTLIDFHLMWSDWVGALAGELAEATGRDFGDRLHELMGVDSTSGRIHPHGLLAATPMSRIRDHVGEMLVGSGLTREAASVALARAWHAPDPVALARPLADLRALFSRLAARGCAVAVATSDDRIPTERTLEALGVALLVGGIVCADDGLPVKPAPDAILRLARRHGVAVERVAMIGDSPADLAMGRNAGAGRVVGVLTGVGDRTILAPLADVVLDSIADLLPSG